MSHIYTISDAVAAGYFGRVVIDRIISEHPELGRRTVGGTLILTERDLERAKKLHSKMRKVGRPKLPKNSKV